MAGASSLSGSIYGGFSQGGAAGKVNNDFGYTLTDGEVGKGGLTNHNTITLIDDKIQMAGAIYGGYSVNGDGSVNADPTFSSFYQGNTLNVTGFKGSVQGIYHFQNYNWVLPKDVVNQSQLITITGTDAVNLNNTKHTIGMENDGNVLHAGDKVVLISKAEGTPLQTPTEVHQGHFIVYDVTTKVEGEQFVLKIEEDNNNAPDPEPDGRLNPKSKAFLMGRLPMLAITNQGADMISDYGIAAARSSVGTCGTNVFAVADGGSNRYDTGSHIKVRDFKLAIGAAKCFELESKSTALAGVFLEHGWGNYNSFNSFDQYGDIRGWGSLRYTGLGALFHMNVAGTGTGQAAAAASMDDKDGLYFNAALRGGRVRGSFDSNDLVDAEGLRGQYDSKSSYFSAMVGTGYAWKLDDKQTLDIYGRYTWNRVQSDSVTIGYDRLNFGSMQSSRMRLGARYSYDVNPQMTPYVGLAYEKEFKGSASGSVYGMSIAEPTLKGDTGMIEVGVVMKPQAAANSPWSMSAGLQGFFGDRRGVAGGVRVRYAF